MNVLWISDFTTEERLGGAELSSAALIQHAPSSCRITHATSPAVVRHDRTHFDIMIVDSLTRLTHTRDMLAKFHAGPFVSIEYDYNKLTPRRHLRHPGDQFLGGSDPWARYYRLFWKHHNRRLTCFMSVRQRDIHQEKLAACGIHLEPSTVWVLSSVFAREFWDDLELLNGQAAERDGYAVLNSPKPAKGTREALDHARRQHLEPIHLFSDLTPRHVLQMLRQRKGIVFTPTREDTCPRLTIEAKLLGCDLHLNDMVQHRDEAWFTQGDAALRDYLMKQPSVFWQKVSAAR